MIFRIKLPDIDDKNKRLVTKKIYKKIRMKKITKERNNKCKIDREKDRLSDKEIRRSWGTE